MPQIHGTPNSKPEIFTGSTFLNLHVRRPTANRLGLMSSLGDLSDLAPVDLNLCNAGVMLVALMSCCELCNMRRSKICEFSLHYTSNDCAQRPLAISRSFDKAPL